MIEVILSFALAASVALNLRQFLCGIDDADYDIDEDGDEREPDEILGTQQKWAARGHPNP